ncbi:MAG: hypothetical protein QW478_03720 [Candidatus Micrarchaeaceae archaeon]
MQNGMCGVGVRPPAFGKGLAKLHESDIKKGNIQITVLQKINNEGY